MNHVTQGKRLLKAVFLERLPIVLANADAEAADGFSTLVPFEINTFDKASIDGLPSIELIVTDSSKQSDSVAAVYRHRVVVGISYGGDSEEAITVAVERYIWAIRKIAKDSQLGQYAGAGPLDTGGEQYTPMGRAEKVESPFVKGAFIEVFITTLE